MQKIDVKAVALFLGILTVSLPVTFAVQEYNLTYDLKGNLIQSVSNYYEYDDFDQLIRVNDTNGNILEEYTYDYEGNRVKKVEFNSDGTNTTTYYVDENFVRVINSSGTYDEVYYYTEKLLVGARINNQSFFYHLNQRGDIDIVTDNGGNVIEEKIYLPFGELVEKGISRLSFSGKESELGLYYFGARYYDPYLKHFTQPDKIIQEIYNPQNLNRYSYVWNNPYKYVDQNGNFIAVVPLAILSYPYVLAAAFAVSDALTIYNLIYGETNLKSGTELVLTVGSRTAELKRFEKLGKILGGIGLVPTTYEAVQHQFFSEDGPDYESSNEVSRFENREYGAERINSQLNIDLQQQNEVGFSSPSNPIVEGDIPRDQNAPPQKGRTKEEVIVIRLPFAPSFVSSVGGVSSGVGAAGGSSSSGGSG